MRKLKKSAEVLAANTTIDLLIIGSGTGIATALAGHEKKLKSLIVEKTEFVGGSTARSGGAFWIPANPILTENGSKDTLEKAEKYLQTLVGNDSPAERRNRVVVLGQEHQQVKRSGRELKQKWVQIYTVENDLITRMEEFATSEEVN